jgi:hypothetical protein
MRLVNCQHMKKAFEKRVSEEGSVAHHLGRHESDGGARRQISDSKVRAPAANMEEMLPGTVHGHGPRALVMSRAIDAKLNENLRAGRAGNISVPSETVSRSIYDGRVVALDLDDFAERHESSLIRNRYTSVQRIGAVLDRH